MTIDQAKRDIAEILRLLELATGRPVEHLGVLEINRELIGDSPVRIRDIEIELGNRIGEGWK